MVFGWATFATWQMVKFAKIIFLVEDALSDAIEDLQKVDETLARYLGMRMFSDSPEIMILLNEALADVRIARSSVTKISESLTSFSRQKYVIDKLEPEDIEQGLLDQARMTAMVRRYPELTEPTSEEERVGTVLEHDRYGSGGSGHDGITIMSSSPPGTKTPRVRR